MQARRWLRDAEQLLQLAGRSMRGLCGSLLDVQCVSATCKCTGMQVVQRTLLLHDRMQSLFCILMLMC
jgi:hypothetical protein